MSAPFPLYDVLLVPPVTPRHADRLLGVLTHHGVERQRAEDMVVSYVAAAFGWWQNLEEE